MSEEADKQKILIVEDEKSQRTALRLALSGEGFRIIDACNGEEGLTCALKEKPDIIVSDISMPDVDGISFLKRLRDEEWGENIPVIILTVMGDAQMISDAVEEDISAYLIKSETTVHEIVDKIKSLISHKK